jgi:phosphate starvation-inducible protein PhoH
MPRSRKARNGAPPVPPGMTAKQIKRRRPIDASYMVPIEPATDNQEWMFNEYAAGKNLMLHGVAGTGKTFSMPDDNSFEMLYDNLRAQETISFWSTSFLRGVTLDNCIVIVDEFSNLNFHELDSIVTRVGEDSKIMFCGDIAQSDLSKESEKSGISDFMKIIQTMDAFTCIEFGINDIVRSGLVKDYLLAKYKLGF